MASLRDRLDDLLTGRDARPRARARGRRRRTAAVDELDAALFSGADGDAERAAPDQADDARFKSGGPL